MACIRTSCTQRCPGKCTDKTHEKRYIVDYRDERGVRKWSTFSKKGDADEFCTSISGLARKRIVSSVPVGITVTDYATLWIQECYGSAKRKRSTANRYEELLTQHVLPKLGNKKLRNLQRGDIKQFLLGKLAERRTLSVGDGTGPRTEATYKRRTVGHMFAVLRAMLQAAISDGAITTNPARALGKELGLFEKEKVRAGKIKALTVEQRAAFLAAVAVVAPRYRALFHTLAGTGMRLGEALALRWDDLDLAHQQITIARSRSEHAEGEETDSPKNDEPRTVDLSKSLTAILAQHEATAKRDALTRGCPLPKWVFHTKTGTLLDAHNVRRAMRSVVKQAGLPLHLSPHSLRHSYASILLANGESPAYVQEQLGHATIELTVTTYGKWLKKKAPGALDRLDAIGSDQVNYVSSQSSAVAHGSKTVADMCFAQIPQTESRSQALGIVKESLVPPIRIERTTRGLGKLPSQLTLTCSNPR